MNLKKISLEVRAWTKEVGKMQRTFFRSNRVKVYEKAHQDLVTQVDKDSEIFFHEKIKESFPDHTILGEEFGTSGNSNSDYTWVIDPLDGTHNFIHGLPIFVISIALSYKNETILAVIYAPILDEMFHAIKGQGAFLGEKKLEVSLQKDLESSFLASGFPYDKKEHPDNNLAYINELVPQIRGLRRLGAAAYDLALVAAGCLDAYWELNLKPWDVAAGRLLVKEAGGTVLDWNPKRQVSILAGNKVICDKILKVFEKVDTKILKEINLR